MAVNQTRPSSKSCLLGRAITQPKVPCLDMAEPLLHAVKELLDIFAIISMDLNLSQTLWSRILSQLLDLLQNFSNVVTGGCAIWGGLN
jgi:hypothetical protein